jgi:murein DD-endopeptidase MepM/ murein hydrolase activator NlpD
MPTFRNRFLKVLAAFLIIGLAACHSGDKDNSPPGGNTQESKVIGNGGGTLILAKIATIEFPAGSLRTDTTTTITTSQDPGVAKTYSSTGAMFGAGNRQKYEIVVNTGKTQPAQPVRATTSISDEFKVGLTSQDEVRLLYLNVYQDDDGQETLKSFEALPERGKISDSELTVTVPPEAFYEKRDGTFEAVLLVAATPTARPVPTASLGSLDILARQLWASMPSFLPPAYAQNTTNTECKGFSIAWPVDPATPQRSQFGSRTHPITGVVKMHTGIDLALDENTDVKAAAKGRIIAYTNNPDGYGNYMILLHEDGSRSVYAHLNDKALEVGTEVDVGTVIAKSGNTGGSTGPHLHFEYAPNAGYVAVGSKVDPLPCMVNLAKGAITVRDNGSAADDAFALALDGKRVCTTEIGAANNCALALLRSGNYTLTITAITAPDNAGTFELTINNLGMRLENGQTTTSGVLAEGASQNFKLTVY